LLKVDSSPRAGWSEKLGPPSIRVTGAKQPGGATLSRTRRDPPPLRFGAARSCGVSSLVVSRDPAGAGRSRVFALPPLCG